MAKYQTLAVTTRYWRPGENYLQEIIDGVKNRIEDQDFVVISEKAISTALGNMVDESAVEPSLTAKLVAKYWMRTVWGFLLGPMCHLQAKMLKRLRDYPLEMGSLHKQVVLQHSGLLQALMFGSEGGIDGSNMAYSYASLTLERAGKIAREIQNQLLSRLGKRVFVMIVDTDKTYSFRNFHFTPRPNPINGIYSFGGFAAYVVGRFLGFKRRATPIALAGCKMPVEKALEVARVANHARGAGAGRTVWDMAERFEVGLNRVSWELLGTVKHKPIVIVRSRR